MGVSWYKPTGRWKAQTQANGKKLGLGYFDTETEAAAAYLSAKRVLHPSAPC